MDSNTITLAILVLLIVILIVLILILFFRMKQSHQRQVLDIVEKELEQQKEDLYQIIFGLNSSLNDVKTAVNRDFISFNTHIKNDLNHFMEHTNIRLNQIEDKMLVDLKESHDRSNLTFQTINEKMIKIDEAQKGLNELSKEIVSLQAILQDKKARGVFGEVELYHILESVFGVNEARFKKQYKLSNGTMVDAVIVGGDTLGLIPIDSKFPLENYRKIYDENFVKSERENAQKAFKKDIQKHILDIKQKYVDAKETAEFAYMFIPAEAVFTEIHSHHSDLVDFANRNKVYLVSPTNLMAYLTAIQSIYLGQKKDEKAKEMKILLNDLALEFKRYYNRNEALYKEYKDLESAYYNLYITGQKIEKRFQEINQLDFEEKDEDSHG